MKRTLLAVLLLAGCEGPMGPRGFPGVPVLDGALEPPGDATVEASDPGDDSALPEAGPSAALTGRVREPSGRAVTRGEVVLVPKAQVAALRTTPLDLANAGSETDHDEPLEDLLEHPSSLRAALDDQGSFMFASVPDGEHFVLYMPDPQDHEHLPGGQLARSPFSAESLRGTSLSLTVSGAPSEQAYYVGSSACTTCHARHTLFGSAHALTVRVPELGSFEQAPPRDTRLNESLGAFASAVTLYYSDCVAGAESTCSVSTTPPLDPASLNLTVHLRRDLSVPAGAPGRYFARLETSSESASYPVALTLGGSRSLQQFVARVALPGGAHTHFVLPFSYQLAGRSDAAPEDRPWVSYRVSDWLELTGETLRTPSHEQSFERQCVGCHSTGFALRGDADAGYGGSAAASPQGQYDLDGDGRHELLAVGCEACHGPGSEHLSVLPRGQRIVSPSLLTPERQNMLCGSCHGRYQGKHGEMAPLSEAWQMPRPGLSRSAFLAQHVSRIEAGPAALYPSGDPRLMYQQYNDFVRSTKYRSEELLSTCSDCHDPHREPGAPSDLKQSDGSASCAGCHVNQRDLPMHVAAKLSFAHDISVDLSQLTCVNCHMVKTAQAGARLPALLDATSPNPAEHQLYLHGDRTSHRFVFTDRSHAAEQPVAATNGCAPCHGELLPVP